MASVGKKLTEAQAERYRRDGFVYPIDAFPAEVALRYRRAMETFEAAEGRELTKGHNFKPHLLFTWVDEIVHHPAILDAVEDLIGPDIRLFHLSVWPKNAGDPAHVSWHQDATYFGLEPAVQVTAWVALTDASIEAGCMEVIPGSHKLGQLHHAEHSDATHNLLSRGQTVTAELDRTGTEFMPVRAGQFSLHHTYLVHNSRPNRSADRRIGLGLSYIPTSVRCTSRNRVTAMLVRGTDHHGHFDDEPRPRADFGEAERAAHADAVARFRASNAEQTSRYASAARQGAGTGSTA
jgi:non-haem Fe2+, alpha-ketoglutarate-dependent halogenase